MPRSNRYSPEVRERAVRMVAERRDEYPSEWAAFTSISAKLGMTPETLRVWVRRAQIDEDVRPGLTTDERDRLKALEKEGQRTPAGQRDIEGHLDFFAVMLDGRPKK
jgi:transposase